MKRRTKLFIFFYLFLLLFILLLPHYILADKGLETVYPTIGKSTFTITGTSTFTQYIKYIYKFTIWIAGILVVLLLVGGGISYMGSAGNPSKMNDAKARILAALVGLGIILISWLISNTINPQLNVLKIENINNMGIWLENTEGKKLVVGDDIFDLPNNFIPYKICFASTTEDGKEPLYKSKIEGLYIFPINNFQGQPSVFSPPPEGCKTLNINARSIKILWKTPAIYINILNNFGVPLPFRVTHSYYNIHDLTQDLYNNKWGSIQVKNSTSTDFGAVFYSQPFYAGKGYIYPGKGKNGPNIITIESGSNVSKFDSVYFFEREPNGSVNASLYKTTHYQEKDENGDPATCPNFSPASAVIDSPQSLGKNVCSEEVQSIKVYRGLAILIQDAEDTPPLYGFTKAEVFTANDPDLTDNYIGQCGSRSLLHWFRYVSKPCPTHFMLLPIKK